MGLAACQRNQAADVKNRHCQEAVADGRVTEARAWLADPTTRGFEVDKSRLAAVTEGFYADGAPRVRAAWDELDGTQVSALLVVELPDDATARRRLFARYTEVASSLEGGHEAETDVGQRCLLVAFE